MSDLRVAAALFCSSISRKSPAIYSRFYPIRLSHVFAFSDNSAICASFSAFSRRRLALDSLSELSSVFSLSASLWLSLNTFKLSLASLFALCKSSVSLDMTWVCPMIEFYDFSTFSRTYFSSNSSLSFSSPSLWRAAVRSATSPFSARIFSSFYAVSAANSSAFSVSVFISAAVCALDSDALCS